MRYPLEMRGWIRTFIWLVLVVGVIGGVFWYFFIDFHRVPEDRAEARNWANAPNLEPGDLALVWRGGTPHIGEVVRCADPADPSRWLVARVIGTGGDRMEFADTGMRVNNFRVSSGACSVPPRPAPGPDGVEAPGHCVSEEVGSSRHDILLSTPYAVADVRVPNGDLFLLSDNRDTPWSYDSRNSEVGLLPATACTQRLVLRLWSQAGWSDAERRLTFLF